MNRTLTFEKFSSLFQTEIMFEVSQLRSPILKQLDQLFYELKQDHDSRKIWKQIEKKIREFSGIKNVISWVDEETNAFVFPKYKDNLPGLLNKIETNKSDMYAEEVPKYIEAIAIMMGTGFLKLHTNRELTAIFLHELGHMYQFTANFSFILMKRSFHKSREIFRGSGILMGVASLFNPAFLPALLAAFTLSRSLTYFEHMREFNADEYAAKYGYADEIATAYYKWRKFDRPTANDSWLKRIWENLKDFLLPSTHPTDKDRICNIIEKMKNEHKKMYPKFKSKINIIYADLKC